MATKIQQTIQIKYGNQNITNYPDRVWQPEYQNYQYKERQPKYHKLSR